MHEQLSIFDDFLTDYKITKPVRLISFFSGIEAQYKALSYLGKKLGVGVESYKTCEWAYNSIIACNAIHNRDFTDYSVNKTKEEMINRIRGISVDYNKPLTNEQLNKKPLSWIKKAYNACIANHNLVNIMDVKGGDLEVKDTDKYEYILTYSFPCGLAGTKIATQNGYKNIEDIVTNDYVLTHTNTYKKVVKIMQRTSDHYYLLKGLGVPKLYLTKEHPLYVCRNDKFEWIKVKDLTINDYFTFNVNQNSIDVNLDENMLWLLGRYVADGYINKYAYHSVNFSIAFKKEEEFLKHSPCEFLGKWKKNKKKCWDYRIADIWLKDFVMKEFGTGSKNKVIPNWVIDLPKDKLQAFFNGYISGDGHIRERGKAKQIMFATVSQNIFMSMQQIIAKLYGCICTCSIRHDERKETFNDTYNCQFNICKDYRNQKKIGDKIITKIRSIEYFKEDVQVYNFEVEEDNSYTCNNVIVHNCQDLSLAGQRAGMDVSQSEGGTRSGLLWEVERILKECEQLGNLPNILVMENVIQVHSEKDMPNFRKWMIALEKLGYNNYWADLNAKDYGIPQNRVRTFMISVLGREFNYKFPLSFKRQLNLIDMLEDKVDEKYYLSQKMIDYLTGVNQKKSKYDRGAVFERNLDPDKEIAATITTCAGQRPTDNFIIEDEDGIPIQEATKKGYKVAKIGDGIDVGSRMHTHRGTVQDGLAQTLKTTCEVGVVVEEDESVFAAIKKNLKIRKLTPKEAGRLMAFQDQDTDHMHEIGLGDGALYHVFGDSICVNLLLGMFARLYGLSPQECENLIKDYIKEIKELF